MSKIYGYATYFEREATEDQMAKLTDSLRDAGAEEVVMEMIRAPGVDTPQLDHLLATAGPGSSLIAPEVHRLCTSAQKLLNIITVIQLKQMRLFIPDKLLLDFRSGEDDPMSQSFLQALSLVAEMERSVKSEIIRKGLDKARAKGRTVGRRPTSVSDIPPIFFKYLPSRYSGLLNISSFARICRLSRPTVYKYLRLLQSGNEPAQS